MWRVIEGWRRYGADSSYISYSGVGRGPKLYTPNICSLRSKTINPLKYALRDLINMDKSG